MDNPVPKIAKQLSAIEISRLKQPGNYAVGGVAGLYLYVNEGAGRSWILRIMVGKVRRHLGLGSYPSVSLAEAREQARMLRTEVSSGVDPICRKQTMLKELRDQEVSAKTFEYAAAAYIEAHSDSWKNAKHKSQWTNTLKTYAFPKIGKMTIGDVTHTDVLAVLEPMWREKNETATRLRGRIESILDWATVHGFRSGDNPARWKGHLEILLPASGKIRQVKHHRALPYKEIANFLERLRRQEGAAPLALEFAILTAARSGEVRNATWNEIDFEKFIWTVPAHRMKAGREHRVPLSLSCMRILEKMDCSDLNSLIFVSPRGGALSDMSMTVLMRRMEVDAVPHGFRSSFRDWVGEETKYPRELVETALAHVLENKVEAAYRRGDALERRREMMLDWADYCSRK